jgi:hypothetical protein
LFNTHAKPSSERNQEVPEPTIRALHRQQTPANGNSYPKPKRAAPASQSGAATSGRARRAWRRQPSERNRYHDALADNQRGEEIHSGPDDVFHPETPSMRRDSGKKGPGREKRGAGEQDRGSNIPSERATSEIPSTSRDHCYVSEMFGV